MKVLKYGFLCEDDAQKIFLQNYLKQVSTDKISFEMDSTFLIKATDKSQVLKRFKEAVQLGFTHYQHDVFFVGIDLDDFETSKMKAFYENMKVKIHPQFQSKTCIFIPVQAIEHWLWYLKERIENPNSTKNIDIEKKTRNDAKIVMYGFKKVSNQISNPIVQKFSENLDIDFLESRSESFKHFHNQVKAFIPKQIA